MAKHTPGPWRIAEGGTFANTIEAQSGKSNYDGDTGYSSIGSFQACESTGFHKEEEENRIANGRLMAAAPELLDALQEMVKWFGGYPEFVPSEDHHKKYRLAIESANSAIAKAASQCLKGEE